jgi:glutamine phosphoribosylpyrophosphate amidotransferase
MIYLQANTLNQSLYLSLDEARQYFSTSFTHYLFILRHEENSAAGVYLAQVLQVVSESQRVTQVLVDTTGLTQIGRYRYAVYGQNSSTNVNPANASVVGECEQGLCTLTDGTQYFDVPQINIDDDVIYNG